MTKVKISITVSKENLIWAKKLSEDDNEPLDSISGVFDYAATCMRKKKNGTIGISYIKNTVTTPLNKFGGI